MGSVTTLFRAVRIPIAAIAVAFFCGSCGGGGDTGTSGGSSASVGVSMTSARDFPSGTTFAPVASVAPAGVSTAAALPVFDNVLVSVTRVALIPASGEEFPDGNGQLEVENAPEEDSAAGAGGFVTVTLPSPVVIDLLHPPAGSQAAKLLNRVANVPAGAYGKIRVYYDNVVGYAGDRATPFHPTAHYHFDVHFVGGKLVIPASAGLGSGVRFYSLAIKVVGLKIHETGNGKVLLRPQLFATVDAPKYIVSGVAENVDRLDGTFEIVPSAGEAIHASFDSGTGWFFAAGRFVSPSGPSGVEALQDTALVDVVGSFEAGVLVAEAVDITFPDGVTGVVDTGWLADNTFRLRLPADNGVYPQPGRTTAFYDDAILPHSRLTDAAVADNVIVKARGYFTPGGIRAFWISIESVFADRNE